MLRLLAEGRTLLAAGSGKDEKGSKSAPKKKRKRRKKSKGKDTNIVALARSLSRKYLQKALQKDREEKKRALPKGDVLLSPSRPNQTPSTTGWTGDR